LRISFVRIDAVAGRAKTLSYKAFGPCDKMIVVIERLPVERPCRKTAISQRMASGQTHVNIFEAVERKFDCHVFEDNTQRV